MLNSDVIYKTSVHGPELRVSTVEGEVVKYIYDESEIGLIPVEYSEDVESGLVHLQHQPYGEIYVKYLNTYDY
jgi:hypothetical protein